MISQLQICTKATCSKALSTKDRRQTAVIPTCAPPPPPPPHTAPLAPVIDTQRTLAYDQLFLCWRLPQESTPAWHYSVEYRRRGVVPGGGSRGGFRGGLAAARWGWQRQDEVGSASAVIDRLEMDSVYVLRVRGCNKAGYGEYSEEVYLHTPPAPGRDERPWCGCWCCC